VFYLGRKLLKTSQRRSNIETAIQEAEQRSWREWRQHLRGAAEGDLPRRKQNEEAEESAKVAQENIMAQSNQIIERLQETANQDLNSKRASDRNCDRGGSHGIAKKLSRNYRHK